MATMTSTTEEHEQPRRGLNDVDDGDVQDEDFFAGVQSSPEDLYLTMVWLASLYLVGDVVCRRILKIVPSLVGHILVGIAFGPQGFDWVRPSPPETWVLLGNLGLVLLILQAGLEMEYDILRLVGLRGIIIAVIGSILPISIGTAIASVFVDDWKSALAAGCSFGPTSAGIAMNVLGQCQNVLERPVGQLIVAAAIVDDILALVILSQLQALTADDPEVVDVVVPLASAILWLFAGGAVALFVFPKHVTSRITQPFSSKTNLGRASLAFLFVLLFALLPATYYSQASYLLGAFLTGLAFCQDTTTDLDRLFRQQFKRIIEWLLKIFFAATIGFQVPIRSFGDATVIARGSFFCLALLGKLAVGSLAPNFYQDEPQQRYRGKHLRDCFVVGFSMMGEAEFAFVVAVYGVSQGLVPYELYASIVFAILMSTVISPLLLRTTLALFPYTDSSRGIVDSEKESEDCTNDKQNRFLQTRATISTAAGDDLGAGRLLHLVIRISFPTQDSKIDILKLVQRVFVCDLDLSIINQRVRWQVPFDSSHNEAKSKIDTTAVYEEGGNFRFLVIAASLLGNDIEVSERVMIQTIQDSLRSSISTATLLEVTTEEEDTLL